MSNVAALNTPPQQKHRNIVSLQKDKLIKILNTEEIANRFYTLFSKDTNKVERFKVSLFNIALDPALIHCAAHSIIRAALCIAELQLPLTKSLGQAYIVKYKQDAEPQIGYKGWLALAERSGKHIRALPVFNCDEFSMEFDGYNSQVKLIPDYQSRQDHLPHWTDKNLHGILIGIKNGDITSHFVSAEKVKQIARKSPSVMRGKYSAYTEWNLEMYQAKAIKYILSKTAMNGLIGKAVEIDNTLDIKLHKESDQPTAVPSYYEAESALELLLQSESDDIISD